jgi:adenine-specific DNA-methyltransferase
MPASIPRLDLKSQSISKEQKEKLRQLFPEVFTEDTIDFEKLRLTLGADAETVKERFGLTWSGKAECFRIIQEPSIGTLKPAKGESVDWDTTENLFIEGDNLETLKLLQKSYYGKVKMIYIDPPYNTGNEFIYPDKFSETLDTYLSYSGQVDAEGKKFSTNTETSGRYHSI